MLAFVPTPSLTPTYVAGVLLAIISASALVIPAYLRWQVRGSPPGPVGLPLLGIGLWFPKRDTHLFFTELNKEYGNIVFFQVMGKPVLLLGNYKTVVDLASKRGTIYSDRPQLPPADMDIAVGANMPMTPWGPKWKEERRMFAAHLGKDAIRTSWRPDIMSNAQYSVLKSYEDGSTSSKDSFSTIVRTFVQTFYGLKIRSDGNPITQAIHKAIGLASASIVPGVYIINLHPWLAHVPDWIIGGDWKQERREWRNKIGWMKEQPFDIVLKGEKEGSNPESFSTRMLNDPLNTLDQASIMHAAGSGFVAGTETTTGSLMNFIYAMLLHPEVQKKAQDEIDRVIGHDRLPTHEDYAAGRLPYVEAIFKETIRFRVTAPWGIPHLTTEDDEYEGYFIPKGTYVFQNAYAIARDPEIYEHGDKFDPDRFMVSNPPLDPRLFVFSAGRRTCPGQHYAEAVVVSNMITLLATMNIVQPLDEDGKEVIPTTATTGKLVDLPENFQYVLQPRSEDALQLLQAAVPEA